MTRDLIYAMHICNAAARHTQISFFVEHINDEMYEGGAGGGGGGEGEAWSNS